MYQTTKSIEKLAEAIGATDAHCHLNLFSNYAEILKISAKRGVDTIVTAGSDAKSNLDNLRIAGGRVFAVVGIDPEFALTESHKALDMVEELLKNGSNVVGIGEIGLDYKKAVTEEEKERQKIFFEKQLMIAKDLDVPVVVHSRNALDDVFASLEKFGMRKVMLHYFEGNSEQAIKAAGKGYLISVPPIASKKRDRAISGIGIEHIVAETDSPLVGKTPADVLLSIRNIAEVKGISFDDAISATTSNVKEFFYI
ncbi:MAG: TatD family hydrolase [Candidatus Micrarchaeaceae archaeon]